MGTPLDTLNARLAAGEISVEQYENLRRVIVEDGASPSRTTTTGSRGTVIAAADALLLYKDAIDWQGHLYPISDVASVEGGSISTTANLIPLQKSTWLTVRLHGGPTIALSEDRTIFGAPRHKAIAYMHHCIRQATFKSRMNNLATRLVKEGRVKLYEPIDKKYRPRNYTDYPVFLTRNGQLEVGSRSFDLKSARREGVFGVGTHWRSLGLSQGYDTDEVAIFEKKGIFGQVPRSAVYFKANAEDTDIVNALLTWLAEPGNGL